MSGPPCLARFFHCEKSEVCSQPSNAAETDLSCLTQISVGTGSRVDTLGYRVEGGAMGHRVEGGYPGAPSLGRCHGGLVRERDMGYRGTGRLECKEHSAGTNRGHGE